MALIGPFSIFTFCTALLKKLLVSKNDCIYVTLQLQTRQNLQELQLHMLNNTCT